MSKIWSSWLYAVATVLALLMVGCRPADVRDVSMQDVPPRTPTSLPTVRTTRAVVSSPTLSPPTRTPTPTLATSKPGPPPGYVEPTFPPTPTVAPFIPASEWREIALPPPKGSAQIVPANVSIPTVHLAIPEQWKVINHPGAYWVLPGPKPATPVLTFGPARPFEPWKEPTPHNMEEFTQSIVRMYERHYGVINVHAERTVVGGQESVVLFVPEGEVCVELFVPLDGGYDVTYEFSFTRALCDAEGTLTETGQFVLKSIELRY